MIRGLLLMGGAVLILFLIIVFYNVRYKNKTSPKKEKTPKEKVVKEKKEKVKKNKKDDNELIKKDAFIRPMDLAKQEQAVRRQKEEEQRKIEEEIRLAEEEKRKAEEDARIKALEEQRESKAGEGYTTNKDFQGYGDRPLTEGKPDTDKDIEIIEPNISEEIKNLSPEMKALLFGDVLKQKK